MWAVCRAGKCLGTPSRPYGYSGQSVLVVGKINVELRPYGWGQGLQDTEAVVLRVWPGAVGSLDFIAEHIMTRGS